MNFIQRNANLLIGATCLAIASYLLFGTIGLAVVLIWFGFCQFI